MKTQKELFEDWNAVCSRLKSMSEYIQNDLSSMLFDEKIIDKANIYKSFDIFRDLYNTRRKELDNLYFMIQELHLSYMLSDTKEELQKRIKIINNIKE